MKSLRPVAKSLLLLLILSISVYPQGGMGPGPGTPHAAGGASSLLTGLQHYYKMEESGNNNRLDSGGSDTFVVAGNAWTTGTGIISTAAKGNASSGSSMTIADSASVEPGAAYTVSVWVSIATNVAAQIILSKWDTGQSTFFLAEAPTAGELRFFVANAVGDGGGNVCTTTDFGFTTGVLTHITVVYDGAQGTDATRLKIYKGSTQKTCSFIGTIASSMTNGTAPLELAHRNGGTYLSGASLIDELGIWTKPLSGSDITCLDNGGAPGSGQQPPFSGCP